MTDKEQINNFAKDINVPRKEPIMVDGVDILKEKINMCFILLLNKLETPETIEQTIYEHLDAFVKEWNDELVHKTQECERSRKRISDLEERIINHSNEIEEYCSRLADKNKKCEKYEQALEKIEKVINNILNSCLGRNTVSCRPAHNVCGDLINILDIIGRAKGEK